MKKKQNQPQRKKEKLNSPHEKPISLAPLTPDEALKALLSTPAPTKKNTQKDKSDEEKEADD